MAAFGCIATRADSAHCQVHHVYGRTYRHRGVLIGPWYVIPLHRMLHDVHSNSPHNVTHFPAEFSAKYGQQKALFLNMVHAMLLMGQRIPFSMEVLNAIMDTRR